MEGIRKKWLEAGIQLSENANAKVICPECQIGYLKTRDEKNKDWPETFDRFMICDHCGKYNILTIKIDKGSKM